MLNVETLKLSSRTNVLTSYAKGLLINVSNCTLSPTVNFSKGHKAKQHSVIYRTGTGIHPLILHMGAFTPYLGGKNLGAFTAYHPGISPPPPVLNFRLENKWLFFYNNLDNICWLSSGTDTSWLEVKGREWGNEMAHF